MDNILLLFLCLILGFLFKKSNTFPKETALVLNKFVIYISLPAMALHYLPKVELSEKLLFPIGVAWIGFLLSFIVFSTLGKRLGWSRGLIGCTILMGGLGNTSFVGIPVIEALYNKEGLETLVLVDLPGTFIALSTVGILVAATYSRGKANFNQIGKRILGFPPFLAFCIGFIFILLKVDMPITLDGVFEKLASTVTPLALVSVGFQLSIEKRSKHWGFLVLVLTQQLFIWPLVILVFYKIILGQSGTAIDVCVMEAGMAPMITAAIVCNAYGLKPKLSNMIVSIGIPLSFITLAFWYWILTLV